MPSTYARRADAFTRRHGRPPEPARQLRHGSPSDDDQPTNSDIAYLARHQIGSRTVVHIAGIHTMGSLGAVDYLTNHLGDLYAKTKDQEFSCVIRCDYDLANVEVTGSSLLAGPFIW